QRGDAPRDLHVRSVGRDREAVAVDLLLDGCLTGLVNRGKLVDEAGLVRPDEGGQRDDRATVAVRPHLAAVAPSLARPVVIHVGHGEKRGRKWSSRVLVAVKSG